MFKDINECTRFDVEEKLTSCIDAAANKWEKNQIENTILKVVKTEFGEKFLNACKEENALLRTELKDLSHDSWFTKIKKYIPYKLIAAAVGLTTRSMIGAGVGVAVTVAGYTISFLSKALYSFEQKRDDSFKSHIKTLIGDNDEQMFRKRYEPIITKFINSVIENNLLEKKRDVKRSIETKLNQHYKMQGNIKKLNDLNSPITEARQSLEEILNSE